MDIGLGGHGVMTGSYGKDAKIADTSAIEVG